MSFHELLLDQRYWGLSVFSVFGMLVTIGIGLSCICRLNSIRPTRWRITSEQALYLMFAFWAMEAFTDLLFLLMFSGYDIAIGIGILLYLHSTAQDWEGDDCVSYALHLWRSKGGFHQRQHHHHHRHHQPEQSP